jgi:hypothetical protein
MRSMSHPPLGGNKLAVTDYTSIKAAIAAPTILNGDTLAIAAGTYTEPGITVDKSLTLQGQAPPALGCKQRPA